MHTTYHLPSAQDVSTEILDSIKATFKTKPITIIVEDDEGEEGLSAEMKSILDDRLKEDETEYLSSNETLKQLKKKYGI